MEDAQGSEHNARDFDWEGARERIAAAHAALAGVSETSPEVLERVWAQRAAQLAKVPVQEDEGESIELVVVQLGQETYGLEVQHVFEIRPAEQITPVPRVPNWVAGVVNLRGRILSVLDLRRFFGLSGSEGNGDSEGIDPPQEKGVLVFAEAPDIEIALLVDDVLAVEAVPASRVQDAADTVRGIHPEHVRGVAERGDGDGLLVLLDLQSMLADEGLIVHEEVV